MRVDLGYESAAQRTWRENGGILLEDIAMFDQIRPIQSYVRRKTYFVRAEPRVLNRKFDDESPLFSLNSAEELV